MTFMRFGGLNQRLGDLALPPESAVLINNLDLHPVGETKTRGGLTEVDESPSGSDPILHLAFLDGSNGRFLYAAKRATLQRTAETAAWTWAAARTWSGNITKARSATASFGSDAEMPGEDAHPAAKGPSIYMCNGLEVPWVDWGTSGQAMPAAKYDTSTPANRKAGYPKGASTGMTEWRDWSTNPPTGLCLIGRGTTEQLLAWGFPNDPNRIDFSALRMPWHFGRADLTDDPNNDVPESDGGWFYALADEPDTLIGVVQHLGRLVVLKRRTTMVYSGLPGVDLALANIYPIGCTSYESVVRVGNNLAWWSDQGPVTLYGVQEFGDLQYANIGLAISKELEGIAPSEAATIHGIHDRLNFRVIWILKRSTDATSRAYVWYYDEPQRWTLFSGKYCAMVSSLAADALAGDRLTIYGGHTGGKLYTMGVGDLDDADAISSSYTTAWQEVQGTDQRKRLMSIEVAIGESGAIGASASVGWDYSSDTVSLGRVARVLGAVSNGFDVALWCSEDDYDAWVIDPETLPDGVGLWSQATRMIIRYEAAGTGFMFQVTFQSMGQYPIHLAGWRPLLEGKGAR